MTGRGTTLAAVAVLALGGCSTDEPSPSPSRSAPVLPPLPGEGRVEPEPTVTCAEVERRSARNLGMWRVEVAVPYAEGAGSERAQDELDDLVDRVTTRLAKTCGEVPAGFAGFAAALDGPLATDSFGQEEYTAVLESWLAWAESVRAARAARAAITKQETCAEQLHPYVDATYSLTPSPTETGQVWFLEATLDNRTGRPLDGSWWGSMRGTSVLPDPFGLGKGPRPGEGRRARLHWGGSSADFLEVQPGVSTQLVAPDADTDVHTAENGRLRVRDFTADLTIRGTRVGCPVVVQPAS